MAKQTGLGKISAADLHRELKRRQKRVGGLVAKRQRLLAKVEALNAEIGGLGASVKSDKGSDGARKRPKNELGLVESLAKVLDGKTYGVAELAEVVQKAGYQTTSPSFRTIVNQALISNPKVFKRVSRGQYTAK